MATTNILGPARSRVDGPLKVTGQAKYAVEFEIPRCVHAWPVVSNIAKGSITAFDTKAAESAPGVLKVLTPKNAPQPKEAESGGGAARTKGIRVEERNPLSDDKVYYAGQYVALVVAQTIEQAQYAASLVRVNYAPEEALLTMKAAEHKASQPKENNGEKVQPKKGDVAPALANGDLSKLEQTYTTPTETHNPIEMSGIIAAWEGDDRLTVWNSTQFVKGVQSMLARTYGLDLEKVRVICPFVGGAFGCKGAMWPHEFLANMAAKVVGQPVKFHVPRREMFTCTGHRTPTSQTISLAATHDGKLQAIRHLSHVLT
ncbi:MAG: xanthine dehydrogenase family protein molybdopterin-binding subunit, partial [Chthoniobacterales bacterium]